MPTLPQNTCSIAYIGTHTIDTGKKKISSHFHQFLRPIVLPFPSSNTWQGWSMWVALIVIIWILGFIIGEAVPFFGDLLSLISSLFDSFFGLIFCK
jgi:hypothetical protein